jgi:hypothetical protein
MAEKRTINIDIKNNADKTATDFDNLNKSIDQTTKSTKNLDATFEEVYGDLQPLTTRMGEAEDRLYELSLAGDTTSKEFQELLTKVGQYRKVQIQTDLAVDGAAQTMTQKLGSALTGATSGFAATQGAMALFGSENEALEESLLKVQGALAIQQGVQGLAESYKELQIGTKLASIAQAGFSAVVGTTSGALKLFRIALISTGIGAIVVGIGLLIANFDKFANILKNPIKSLDKLGKGFEMLKLALFPLMLAIDLVKKGLQALGIIESEEDIAKEERHQSEMERIRKENEARRQRQQERQDQFDREIALMEAEGKNSFALRQAKIRDSIAIMEQERKAYIQTLEIAMQSAVLQQAASEIIEEYKKNLIDLNKNILDSENNLKINIIKNNKAKAQSYKEVQDAQQKALDEEIDAEIQLLAELDKIRQENKALFRTDIENELNLVAEKYDVLESMAYGNAEALNEIEIARLNAENDIKLKYGNEAYEAQKAIDEKAAADQKALDEKTKKDALATQQSKVRFANDALGAISDLTNAFAGESEKAQEKAFKINKAIGITQAIINTAGAVSAAINPAVGGLGIPAGLPGAVLAAATGAAQIATIAKTQFQGGDSGGVDAPPSSIEATPPSFNVVGDSGINQLAQLQQQPTQAYVVSGEVTTGQALDRNRITNATL